MAELILPRTLVEDRPAFAELIDEVLAKDRDWTVMRLVTYDDPLAAKPPRPQEMGA